MFYAETLETVKYIFCEVDLSSMTFYYGLMMLVN